MVFVGLIEDKQKKNLFKISRELLLLSNYKIVYENISKDIVGLSKNGRTIMLHSLTTEDMKNEFFKKISFDIIAHSFLDNISYTNLGAFKNTKVCILNSDDENIISILTRLKDEIAITYGFNNKATLTISSYNISPYISANICLQRAINPLYGKKIEPFEYGLELESDNEEMIYPLLAASLVCIVLGDSILNNDLYEILKINL